MEIVQPCVLNGTTRVSLYDFVPLHLFQHRESFVKQQKQYEQQQEREAIKQQKWQEEEELLTAAVAAAAGTCSCL